MTLFCPKCDNLKGIKKKLHGPDKWRVSKGNKKMLHGPDKWRVSKGNKKMLHGPHKCSMQT